MAREQTGGKGRRGRKWVSPPGNFYGSHLFPTEIDAARRGLYSFVAALAVYDALTEFCSDAALELKWPNDVLLGGAKLSGLLLETGQTHTQSWIIIGIGINLISSPSDLPYAATHLSETADVLPSPGAVYDALSRKMEYWKKEFETKGFEPIRNAWLNRAANIPGKVVVRLPDETFEGEALDLLANGALQVQLANGSKRQVHAGDVYPG